MVNPKFFNLLKKLRKEKHLTQAELAAKVGVDHTYISKLELTRNIEMGLRPSENIVEKLADALDTDPEVLLLLAGEIPHSLKMVLFKDRLAAEFVKILPKLNAEERVEIQELINSVKERNNDKV